MPRLQTKTADYQLELEQFPTYGVDSYKDSSLHALIHENSVEHSFDRSSSTDKTYKHENGSSAQRNNFMPKIKVAITFRASGTFGKSTTLFTPTSLALYTWHQRLSLDALNTDRHTLLRKNHKFPTSQEQTATSKTTNSSQKKNINVPHQ